MRRREPRTGRIPCWAIMLILAAGGVMAYAAYVRYGRDNSRPPPLPSPSAEGNISERVHDFCGACHAYPPPDTFPRELWRQEVENGYQFFSTAGMNLEAPPMDEVIAYYRERAPDRLSPARFENAKTPPPVQFQRTQVFALPDENPPAIANVNLVHLSDEKRLDLLACDMRRGQVLLCRPYESSPKWEVLAEIPNPCHTEIVDLDGDGKKDILVANLGSFTPTDQLCGSVVWLRGNGDGSFTPYTLLENVGRVADVQAADFRGTGKLDLVVAAFGWRDTGEVYFLENQTTDWNQPKFVPRIIDKRHGAIHVIVADLNDDKKPDFVALFAQEHETVAAFVNDGKGNFTAKDLFRGPHPAYGSSGIQLTDINGDGKPDILYTNGDTLDMPYILKPYHGIQWLENKGDLKFEHHWITPMYGVHRAVAGDFTGTGRIDIVAVNFLPHEAFPYRADRKLDSVIYLSQVSPGRFERHSLETITCNHTTCVAGDIFGRGKLDFVTGNFTASTERKLGVAIWKNMSESAKKP